MSYSKFAHLMGFKKKASEDEDDDKEKGKKAKSRHAEEERDEEDAEEDDDEKDMEDDDDSDPDAEDDDDAGAEEDDSTDVKKGSRAERKRCAAIFGSKHAAGRPDMAAHLAFNTRMSAREAISTLAAMGPATALPTKRSSLDERMQAEQVRLGPDAGGTAATGKNALVAKMTSLYDTARGIK
ncbi:hypothetical protein KGP26_07570 [Serratia sp. JSRIV002]|uniref:hypothetical protein n=1 Tax=Serratia sp. JSRIV002 TaxID=2831894 RepID=UPI001CC03112|nr:hypothetical protein [Serratia sp. JSRIV002]UAN52911.1 hypothetical protein KGP26_07570 [Serratia sp. JSRIV002]